MNTFFKILHLGLYCVYNTLKTYPSRVDEIVGGGGDEMIISYAHCLQYTRNAQVVIIYIYRWTAISVMCCCVPCSAVENAMLID